MITSEHASEAQATGPESEALAAPVLVLAAGILRGLEHLAARSRSGARDECGNARTKGSGA